MSIDDAEYKVASNAIKAERHYRVYLYVLTTLSFLVFLFIAHRIIQIETRISENNTRLIMEAEKLNKAAMEQLRIQSEEILRYTTCLLIEPIEDRKSDVRQECFRKSDLPGGLEQEDFNITASFVPVPKVAVASQRDDSPSPNPIALAPTSPQEFSPPARKGQSPSSPPPPPTVNQSPEITEQHTSPLVTIPKPSRILQELLQL